MIDKKWYPWIPVIGAVLTVIADPDETGLDNPLVFYPSALLQALSFVAIIYGVFL